MGHARRRLRHGRLPDPPPRPLDQGQRLTLSRSRVAGHLIRKKRALRCAFFCGQHAVDRCGAGEWCGRCGGDGNCCSTGIGLAKREPMNQSVLDAPPPLRTRRDGWTPERQAAFLTARRVGLTIADAALSVGMSHGASTGYAEIRARLPSSPHGPRSNPRGRCGLSSTTPSTSKSLNCNDKVHTRQPQSGPVTAGLCGGWRPKIARQSVTFGDLREGVRPAAPPRRSRRDDRFWGSPTARSPPRPGSSSGCRCGRPARPPAPA